MDKLYSSRSEGNFCVTKPAQDRNTRLSPIYAILLERGQYIGSVSTMYRVLHENRQVRERRRRATHPPRKVPELIATGPGGHHQTRRSRQGRLLRRVRDDRPHQTEERQRLHALALHDLLEVGYSTRAAGQLIHLDARRARVSVGRLPRGQMRSFLWASCAAARPIWQTDLAHSPAPE